MPFIEKPLNLFQSKSTWDVQKISEKLPLLFEQIAKSLHELWNKDNAVNLH